MSIVDVLACLVMLAMTPLIAWVGAMVSEVLLDVMEAADAT